MQRLLAVAATAAIASAVALAPAISSAAAPVETFPDKATWVNGTVRIIWSTPADGIDQWPASDVFLSVTVDGVSVDEQDDAIVTDRLVEVPRAASAGPAHVEVVLNACLDGTEGYTCTPHSLFDATIAQKVITSKPGQVSADTLLTKLTVAKEVHASTYARSRFPLWIDADKDGESTRAEVLAAESKKRVVENSRHTVTTGRWVSPYDGKVATAARTLDIDHLVPLQEAWTSGAYAWSAKKREAYANDLGYGPSLIAVSKQAARSKGAKEPNRYLPALTSYRCAYVRNYIAVKYRWGLKVDPAEKTALRLDLAQYCVNTFVTKPGKPNITALVGRTTTTSSSSSSSGSSFGGATHDARVVHPGAFCSPSGSFGYSVAGTRMECRTSATDARNRWRQA